MGFVRVNYRGLIRGNWSGFGLWIVGILGWVGVKGVIGEFVGWIRGKGRGCGGMVWGVFGCLERESDWVGVGWGVKIEVLLIFIKIFSRFFEHIYPPVYV